MPLSKQLEALYDECVRDNINPTLDSLYPLLQLEISRYETVFILVDALDECLEKDGSRHILLRKLGSLTPSIRLMVTSRPHIDVTRHIPNARPLEVLASNDDITKYVYGRLSDTNTEFGRVLEGQVNL
jgi:hypothetical protein